MRYLDNTGLSYYEQTVKNRLDMSSDIANYHNSGSHNCMYRGAYLGDTVTDEQYANISNGTFKGLYIGDYWTINNVKWRIAEFDYYWWVGDTSYPTTHHAVIVPDVPLYNYQMNPTDTTDGGYVGSEMYTTGLEQAKTIIKEAFGESHILTHRDALVNAVTDGAASSWLFTDSQVELMNEVMVYGTIAAGKSDIGNIRNVCAGNGQFSMFRMGHLLVHIRRNYWLRDVASNMYFAYVIGNGNASFALASASAGVRPYFCIIG